MLCADAPQVMQAINAFAAKTFRTRGGRLGSGMGSLLEALWVYHMNSALANEGGLARQCELAWLQDHEPADFACLYRGAEWEPQRRRGELFRIEAKSMNVGVDEAKGHFTNLAKETAAHDQLLVLIWSWESADGGYSWPRVRDYFLGPSRPIINARDRLHLARGGAFVESSRCPDRCAPDACTHHGEPLNAAGKRERRSGPTSCKPANVEYAANFGGLVRMLKTDNDAARTVFRTLRKKDDVVHAYVSFIHKHFPAEEINQFRKAEWQAALEALGVVARNPTAAEANRLLREQIPDYQDRLRNLFQRISRPRQSE